MANVKINSESILDVLNKSGKSVLSQRARSVYAGLKMSEEAYIREKRNEVEKISMAIRNHMDLSVRSTQSLTLDKIDSEAWIARLHELHMDLRNAKIELEVALAVDSAMFPADADTQSDLMEIDLQ